MSKPTSSMYNWQSDFLLVDSMVRISDNNNVRGLQMRHTGHGTLLDVLSFANGALDVGCRPYAIGAT